MKHFVCKKCKANWHSSSKQRGPCQICQGELKEVVPEKEIKKDHD